MIVRPKRRLVAPLVAMSMALVLAASASAQDRQYQRSQSSGISLQINFGSTPHWSRVPGTQVREIRQGERTDYDMFQYGRSYYAYNHRNDRWYMSRRWRGEFRLIDDRYVPSEIRRVPRNHWRNYPASWEGRDDRYDGGRTSRYDRNDGGRTYDRYDGGRTSQYDRNDGGRTYDRNDGGRTSRYDRNDGGSSATLQVTFGSTPRWSGISGTRVETIPMADRRDYDVFRYDNMYYAYDNDRWYSSSRESGNFAVIDDRAVPTELSRVPRDQWHSYPAAWQDRNPNGTPPGLDRKDGMPPGQEKKNRDHRGDGY